MRDNNRIPIGKICSECKGQLYSVEYYSPGQSGASWKTICLACGHYYGDPKECELELEMIVTPPLDDLRFYKDEYGTDLRKIPPQNRFWRYIAGQILSISPASLPLGEYFLAIYTLLTPHPDFTPFVGGANEYYWELGQDGDLPAYGVPGRPIIRVDKKGIWKTIVNVGYAYFILVTIGGFANPQYGFLKEVYQTRLPFENLERVVLTHLVRAKEVFHQGTH